MAKRIAAVKEESHVAPRRSSRHTGSTAIADTVVDKTPIEPKAKRRKNKGDDIKSEAADEEEDVTKGKSKNAKSASASDVTSSRRYWLMKAEPESRLEKGVDIKFSIDDLAARTKPEPWDGIRNYVARNNLRAMKKGDLAFFYHSSCKVPGIVGTMEIVQERSPDLTAHNPKSPYYDESSKPDNPKWSLVHVEFRSKFDELIGLKELKGMVSSGEPLENMQMLRQTRLSVSKVTEPEWECIMKMAEAQSKE